VSDRAREGVFSSLGELVARAAVLDLFAGTGAMGIEALSRGAAMAVFVERSPRAIASIRQNLERTRLADRARVVRSDVDRFLDGIGDCWRPPRRWQRGPRWS
jgi:16S rRNA (guanine(966)-N(2))-methyltransferase RsmD